MAEKTNAPGATGSAVAGNGQGGQAGNVAVKSSPGIPAAASVPAFGGNRGGKPREDGLVPGSAEAAQADKDKDAKRKRDARAAQKLADPPALPSAPANGVHTVSAPADGPGSVPGSAAANEAVPWDPADLRPLLDELIEQTEQSRIDSRRSRAAALGLPDRVIKEAASGAVYPKTAKTALARSGSNGAAKLMNSLGVSGKYSDAAIALTALTAIVVSNRRSDARFEEIIAEFKKAQGPKPPTTKP